MINSISVQCAVYRGKFDRCNLHSEEKGRPSSHVKMTVDFFAVGGLAEELWWPLDQKLENRDRKSKITKKKYVSPYFSTHCSAITLYFVSLNLRSSTCPLTSFFWMLSQVIFLKLKKVLYKCLLFPKLFLNDNIYSYTKKTIWHLSISSFKNLKDWKVNIFLSFSGER